MIISSATAARICSTHAVLQAVPELLAPVEAYAKASRELKTKPNCQDCDALRVMAPVEEMALTTIAALPSDAVKRLRDYLKQGELYCYVSVPGGKPKIQQLK